MIPDYTFYTSVYGGHDIPEADFPRLADEAYEDISWLIYPHSLPSDSEADEETVKRIKKAVCSQAELIYSMPEGNVISEKTGDVSFTYSPQTASVYLSRYAFSVLNSLGLINTWC